MTAPEMTAPECSGCKWFRDGGCMTAPRADWTAAKCREAETDCGNEGRYYEPKETSE